MGSYLLLALYQDKNKSTAKGVNQVGKGEGSNSLPLPAAMSSNPPAVVVLIMLDAM